MKKRKTKAPRQARITIALARSELAAIVRASEAEGRSASSWARRALIDALVAKEYRT